VAKRRLFSFKNGGVIVSFPDLLKVLYTWNGPVYLLSAFIDYRAATDDVGPVVRFFALLRVRKMKRSPGGMRLNASF